MPKKHRTVIVTGSRGFVGRAVVERLLQEPDTRVRCLMRAGSESPVPVGGDQRVSACAGDITRPETLANALDGTWGVVNLAGYREFWAQRREHFYEVNHHGAENVFRAALGAGAEKVVQVSTPLAYGVPGSLPFDEHSEAGPHPSDYGRSQYLGDQAETTGVVPDDRTVVVERFRDEIGDWRVCILSPFGAQVHAPWAMAVAARLELAAD